MPVGKVPFFLHLFHCIQYINETEEGKSHKVTDAIIKFAKFPNTLSTIDCVQDMDAAIVA